PAWGGRVPWPSSEHHLGVGDVIVERRLGQPFEGLDVTCPRPGDHALGQRWPRRRLVPAKRLAVVARVLLVEGRLWTPGSVLGERPEAGRVRRQCLVGKDDAALEVETEFELRVRDDDSALAGVRGGEAVEAQRVFLERLEVSGV